MNRILAVLIFLIVITVFIIISLLCKEHFYSVYTDGKMFSAEGVHSRSDRLWAEELFVNGPIIQYLNQLSKEYGVDYVILAADVDHPDFETDPNKLRLVASRDPNSDSTTIPIPQHDDYFLRLTSYPGKPEIPFENKKPLAVWRGKRSVIRNNLVPLLQNSKYYDAEFTNDLSKHMSRDEQLEYKYIVSIDGHGWPGSINWVLESGSVPLIHSQNHVWYFPLLEPWVDYVPIDRENYDQVIEYLEENPELAKEIAENATRKIRHIHKFQRKYLQMVFETQDYDLCMSNLLIMIKDADQASH